MGRKVRPRFEVRPFVVVKSGHRGNYALQRQRELRAKLVWAHVDEIKRYVAPAVEVEEAAEQAEEAAQPEYVMEAIIEHRGNWSRAADREFLIKWAGYGEEHNTWETAETLNNDKAIKQYVREVNADRAAAKKSAAVVRQAAPRSEFIQADLLEWQGKDIVSEVCRRLGVDSKQVVLVWASPPCRTMSNSAYNTGRGSGHGYNYRDFKDPQRGPCCSDPSCKYRQMAVEHDRFLPMLQSMIAADRTRGCTYDFVVENPRACLRLRPYAWLSNWPASVPVDLKVVNLCAFDHPAMKPTDLFTSLVEYQPRGRTGSGLCEKKCKAGHVTATGSYLHELAFAQEPARNPSGHMRVAMPSMLLNEVLQEAIDRRGEEDLSNLWVIDLFCGFKSMADPAMKKGLNYVGVDIKDCSAALKKTTGAEDAVSGLQGAECKCAVKCPPRYSDTTAAASHGWACSRLYERHRFDSQGRDRYAARK